MSGKARYLLVQYITVARVPLSVAAGLLLWYSEPGQLLASIVVGLLVICELTDIFDGHLARKLGASSPFGALFDPYCDSISRMIIFFGLATKGLCPMWLFLVMALRDVSVAYIRIMYILSGKKPSARLSGKTKAWVQGLGAIALAVLYAYSNLSLGNGDFVFWQRWMPTTIVLLVAAVTLWSLLDYFGASQQKDAPPDGPAA
jgi:CDP-diacylglycerol--glycerol-3-phosphate 3-phosphatidyltransferase